MFSVCVNEKMQDSFSSQSDWDQRAFKLCYYVPFKAPSFEYKRYFFFQCFAMKTLIENKDRDINFSLKIVNLFLEDNQLLLSMFIYRTIFCQ